MEKILILTGELGDGHKQAAHAIAQATRITRPDVDVEVVDFLQWTHPYLHQFNRYCYMTWVKNFPGLYGYLFRKTRDDHTPLSILFKKIRLFDIDRMMKLLNDVQPSVVVSTLPSAAAAMSFLKVHGLTQVPTITVITDHSYHSYWLHPETDLYLVGSDRVRQALEQYSIPAQQIRVTGIPVRESFTRQYDRLALRHKHGLDPSLPVVMVMGGGYGLIGKELLSLLMGQALDRPMQFVIVCGHNEKLKAQLETELAESREFRDSPHRILVKGYVDYIHELMALSDLLVTKPGGITTAEALAQELPMLLYKPLPGQEQDNAAFLTDLGVAEQADSECDLAEKLIRLFQNSSRMATMKENARRHPTKTAAVTAVHEIMNTMREPATKTAMAHAMYAEA